MPTRYWLVGRAAVVAVSRLEAAGGVRRAESTIDPAARRRRPPRATPPSATQQLPPTTTGPARPAASAAPARASSASTRTTPGTSPAATTRSAPGSPSDSADARRPAMTTSASTSTSDVHVPQRRRRARRAARDDRARREIAGDPPRADDLSNAIGAVHDTIDDVLRVLPGVADAEAGRRQPAPRSPAVRRRRGRRVRHRCRSSSPATPPRTCSAPWPPSGAPTGRATPGWLPARVDTVVGRCCVLVGLMRRLRLDAIEVVADESPTRHVRRRAHGEPA